MTVARPRRHGAEGAPPIIDVNAFIGLSPSMLRRIDIVIVDSLKGLYQTLLVLSVEKFG
jgi:hypothetical protein